MPKGVPNKRYTAEFKKLVVETMQKEKMSYRETARQFGISDDKRVAAWERIYLTEGPEGFSIERRGPQQQGQVRNAAERGRRRSAGRSPAAYEGLPCPNEEISFL